MTTRRLATAALALWLITAGAAVWLFVVGRTEPSTDGRRVVLLTPAERDLVLGEMRGLLQAVQGIVDGLARDDRAQVARAARSAGMASAADPSPALVGKLPLEFKRLGMSVHQGMDDLALAAEQGEPTSALLERLAGQLSTCAACHASWRFSASEQP